MAVDDVPSLDDCARHCMRHRCVKFQLGNGRCIMKKLAWLSASRDAASGTALDPALHTCGTGDVFVRKTCAACTSADCGACAL